MASKAVLLASLASLAVALLPPCLPGLGPQFCPATVSQDIEDNYAANHEPVTYPSNVEPDGVIVDVLARLDKTRLEADLRRLTNADDLPNRHCMSIFGSYGFYHIVDTSHKIVEEAEGAVSPESGLEIVKYRWHNETPQHSLLINIIGTGDDEDDDDDDYDVDDGYDDLGGDRNVIVVGAHMDSINHKDRVDHPDNMTAPGADDNGSGTVVLLEVLRAVLPSFAEHRPINDVQFHWYAAEEIGLVGSNQVFEDFKNHSIRVKAMLNLDMVGYSGGHEVESPKIAVQTDQFVDMDLTAYVKKLVNQYTNAEAGGMRCGYPCSDHSSAHNFGFPSAMIGESSYMQGGHGRPNGYPYIHSADDTIDHLDFDYMLEFAKVTAAFIVDLAYTDFNEMQ